MERRSQEKIGAAGVDQSRSVWTCGSTWGARLESMTKHLKAPILIDAQTAGYVHKLAESSEMRSRKFGRIRPYGMDKVTTVFELVPPALLRPDLTDTHLSQFETAVDLITAGQWNDARTILDLLPDGDEPVEFLKSAIEDQDQPPAEWDGVITMKQK